MIAASDERSGTRRLAIALILSAAIHTSLLPLALGGFRIPHEHPERAQPALIVTISSAPQIAPSERPAPRAIAAVPQYAPPARRAQPEPARAAPPRPELARAQAHATPQPARVAHPAHEAMQRIALARAEQRIAAYARALQAARDPLALPTVVPSPASRHPAHFDVLGREQPHGVEALLTPIRHWYDGDRSCYYARYSATFAAGGNEDGVIPWPVCYPRSDDAMAHPPYPHRVPVPVPPPGYTLPSGTYLTPFLRAIYDERAASPPA